MGWLALQLPLATLSQPMQASQKQAAPPQQARNP
jgi:hypothetical protein